MFTEISAGRRRRTDKGWAGRSGSSKRLVYSRKPPDGAGDKRRGITDLGSLHASYKWRFVYGNAILRPGSRARRRKERVREKWEIPLLSRQGWPFGASDPPSRSINRNHPLASRCSFSLSRATRAMTIIDENFTHIRVIEPYDILRFARITQLLDFDNAQRSFSRFISPA